MSDPDVIVVESEREEEVVADRAELSFLIHGSSFVTGAAVCKQAREVAEFVRRLQEIGFPEDTVSIQGISANVTQGLLTKSSGASYLLRVRCMDLVLLGSLLTLLPSLRNTMLLGIEWGYSSIEEARFQWLNEAVQVANRKAAALAEGLKVSLIGIHRCSEKITEVHQPVSSFLTNFFEDKLPVGKSNEPKHSDVLPLHHSKKVKLRVVVDYRIGGYAVREDVAEIGSAPLAQK